jgi:hypothetical protein
MLYPVNVVCLAIGTYLWPDVHHLSIPETAEAVKRLTGHQER